MVMVLTQNHYNYCKGGSHRENGESSEVIAGTCNNLCLIVCHATLS